MVGNIVQIYRGLDRQITGFCLKRRVQHLVTTSRTLRRGVAAFVASELLAGPATIDATLPGTCASRTRHAGFVGTEHTTNIFVREYGGRCAPESECGTQHRAVVLAKEARLGHR